MNPQRTPEKLRQLIDSLHLRPARVAAESRPTPFTARQGEVLLRQVPISVGLDLRPVLDQRRGRVLAGGNTGHVHELDGGLVLEDDMKNRYVQIEEPVVLRHEEHAPIEVPPGLYQVTIQREYRPVVPAAQPVIPATTAETSWRNVQD